MMCHDAEVALLKDQVTTLKNQTALLERMCQNLQHQIDLIKGRPLTPFPNPLTPWGFPADGQLHPPARCSAGDAA